MSVIKNLTFFFYLSTLSLVYCAEMFAQEDSNQEKKANVGPKDQKNESSAKDDKKDDKKKGEAKKKDKEKDEKEDEPKAVKLGNLALATSQQPGSLVGLGDNVIDKGDTQFFFLGDDYYGKSNKHFVDLVPSILYGITDDLSVFFNIPVAVFKDGPFPKYDASSKHIFGLEDVFVQLEWAYYTKETTGYIDQGTIVVNVAMPTGSITAPLPTGFGTPSVFIGTTYGRTAVEWLYVLSAGAVFGGTNNKNKMGNLYLYQGLLGRNIAFSSDWIFCLLVEVDGFYSDRNIIGGFKDPNSGGNTIYVTPSIWFSTEKIIFQLGAGVAVQQHLFGIQHREIGNIVLNFGYKFN